MKCIHCPLRDSPGRCLGSDRPDRFGSFCEWAEGGDPGRLRHIAGTSALADSAEPEPGPAATEADVTVETVPIIVPLAGDLVEALTHRIGADRLAKWVAARLGTDCGCEQRRIRLNELDAKLRRYLGL